MKIIIIKVKKRLFLLYLHHDPLVIYHIKYLGKSYSVNLL
ncbi:hypothetical protein C923_04239 [Plasmodium falciparum UGT5.1]|uniref:Uncharacterized protein n=1 Tax=Plasmodium falciparum UGT5.1 TaxID=1237627 RepID=W7JJK5_PLAFA|nr:hypothetical protein C923_04239 [Plasmodium falciparum UGT5.1]